MIAIPFQVRAARKAFTFLFVQTVHLSDASFNIRVYARVLLDSLATRLGALIPNWQCQTAVPLVLPATLRSRDPRLGGQVGRDKLGCPVAREPRWPQYNIPHQNG